MSHGITGTGLRSWIRSTTAVRGSSPSSGPPRDVEEVLASLGVKLNPETGEVTLDDHVSAEAELWHTFKVWCMTAFQDSEDMMQKLMKRSSPSHGSRLINDEDRVTCQDFCEQLAAIGWTRGHEELLFKLLCFGDDSGVALFCLKWLDLEKRRLLRKQKARQKSFAENKYRTGNQIAVKTVLVNFKKSLKQTYGSYVRAWRRALSPSDSMVLQKSQFFLALSEMGWAGEARKLWKAFGKNKQNETTVLGSISIDELDPKSAETLAHFCAWIAEHFGSATGAFRELDRNNKNSVSQHEFLSEVKELGFHKPAKALFHGLDKDGKKAIVLEDLLFLDRWRPAQFLLAVPNQSAVDHFRSSLVNKYKNYVKAWRRILDTDNSNRCDWQEFQAACSKHLQFTGDVSGAWRALDKKLRGYVTLADIDPKSSACLEGFRKWATQEFGSVLSAFSVFDTDGSSAVSSAEFKRACRIYDFDGDPSALFKALDVERNGSLSKEEVTFLDEWEEIDATPLEDEGPAKLAMAQLTIKLSSTFVVESPGNVASARASNPRRRAYTCMPTPERSWWHDLPCKPASATPRKNSSSKGNAMYCSYCKMRGFCSHVNEHAQRVMEANSGRCSSTTPSISQAQREFSEQRPMSKGSARTPSLRAASAMSHGVPSLRAASAMSVNMPSVCWDAPGEMCSGQGASPLASQEDAMPRHMISIGCGSPDAELQRMALRFFPMGSVTPVQGKVALRMLESTTVACW